MLVQLYYFSSPRYPKVEIIVHLTATSSNNKRLDRMWWCKVKQAEGRLNMQPANLEQVALKTLLEPQQVKPQFVAPGFRSIQLKVIEIIWGVKQKKRYLFPALFCFSLFLFAALSSKWMCIPNKGFAITIQWGWAEKKKIIFIFALVVSPKFRLFQ